MSPEIHLRLYEELNDFLPLNKRKRRFAYRLKSGISVKKLLAELGVPRDQVELVLMNDRSVGFSHILKPGEFVSLYPVFESFDVGSLICARKKPLRRTRFLTGPGLVRLACYLRLIGFDTVDSRSWPLKKSVSVAEKERRIVLTRNPALMRSPDFSRIYLVREATPKRQLIEVMHRFDLYNSAHSATLQSIIGSVPPPRAEGP
jgi:hypothetical protein